MLTGARTLSTTTRPKNSTQTAVEQGEKTGVEECLSLQTMHCVGADEKDICKSPKFYICLISKVWLFTKVTMYRTVCFLWKVLHEGNFENKIHTGIVFSIQGWSFPGGGLSQSQREFWWTCILFIFQLVAEHLHLLHMTRFIFIVSFLAHAKRICKVPGRQTNVIIANAFCCLWLTVKYSGFVLLLILFK